MLDDVVVDLEGWSESASSDPDVDRSQLRLIPLVYLIADSVTEAGHVRSDVTVGSSTSWEPGKFIVRRIFASTEGRPNALDMAVNGFPVLSPRISARRQYLRGAGVTASTAAFLLASAGLDIALPAVSIGRLSIDDLHAIREPLEEERQRYKNALVRLTDECFDRLNSGVYSDTVDWAISEAAFSIRPKALEYERAVSRLNRTLLSRIGLTLLAEGIPTIGSSLITGSVADAGRAAVAKTLEALTTNLARSINDRALPEAAYGFKLRAALQQY